MSRRVSLSARQNQDAAAGGDFEVVLFYITHPDLSEPYRFSTDNADELSLDPYIRGTRSTWMGSNPATDGFVGILAEAVLPDDKDDALATGQIAIALSDQALVTAVRSVTTVPSIHLAVVMASSPNVVEYEVRDLDIVSAEINGDEILLTFSRENAELEPCPAGRFTKDAFPGLHK